MASASTAARASLCHDPPRVRGQGAGYQIGKDEYLRVEDEELDSLALWKGSLARALIRGLPARQNFFACIGVAHKTRSFFP